MAIVFRVEKDECGPYQGSGAIGRWLGAKHNGCAKHPCPPSDFFLDSKGNETPAVFGWNCAFESLKALFSWFDDECINMLSKCRFSVL